MQKVALVLFVLVFAVAASGCFGPHKLTRQYDDWLNQQYVDNPWVVGNIVSAAFIGVGYAVTSIVDFLVLNTIDFWGTSAWPFGPNKGTPFNHKNPTMPGKK